MNLRDLPIQKKLRLAILLVSTLIVVLASTAFLVQDIFSARDALFRQYGSLAQVVADNIASAVVFDDAKAAKQTLETLRSEAAVEHAVILSADQRVFAEYALRDDNDGGHHHVTQAFASCPDARIDSGLMIVCRPIFLGRERVGLLSFEASLYPLYATIWSDALIVTAILVLALALAFVAANKLAALLATPVVRLTDLVGQVAARQDYTLRTELSGKDEIGILGTGLNNLLEQLQKWEQDLKGYSAGLEKQIDMRTQELRETVRALEKAKARAEVASQAKSEFLSSMSHELRTPLNSILGYAQLMEMDPVLKEEQKEYLQYISQAGNHLLTLINDILDLARIEAGRLEVSLDNVLLSDLLAECESLIFSLARQREVELRFCHGESEQLQVRADFGRLRQVMLNLLSNAIKYNRVGGTVEVWCEMLDDSRVRLLVRDSGRGIPRERLEELFEPFSRLGAERSAIEGTGIGLVITKRLVELMGGELGFDSKPDQGSVFWVDMDRALVARPETMDTPGAAPAAATAPQAGLVLYVEDNIANQKLMVSALTNLRPGVELIVLPNGEEALAFLERRQPNVILLDIGLPGMNGYAILQAIRARPELTRTPVLALTADAMQGDRERGRAAGFDAYMTKPLILSELLDILDSHLPSALSA